MREGVLAVTWLELLKQLRRANNSPSRQEIANWANMTVNQVSNIFTGREVPTRAELIRLVIALDPEQESLPEILAAYDDTPESGLPFWLAYLRVARIDAGRPTLATLTGMTGLPVSVLSAIFRGDTTPSRPVLTSLIDALDCSNLVGTQILEALDETTANRTDLASAIEALAQALTDVAAAIHAHRISAEQRQHL